MIEQGVAMLCCFDCLPDVCPDAIFIATMTEGQRADYERTMNEYRAAQN